MLNVSKHFTYRKEPIMTRLQILAHTLLPVFCLLLTAGGPAPQATAPAAKATPADLKAQLIAAAEEGRRLAQSAYASGQGSVEEGNVWTARGIQARLLAAPDRQSRLAILAEGVKAAQDWET